ncbi:MAG: hypothetical protein ACRDYX_04815 [Egibacteraceae bacterium]
MPTVTYSNAALALLNVGLSCIGLDLSSGDNSFDLHRIDDPNDCGTSFSDQQRASIHAIFDPITISIKPFRLPGSGEIRLDHLAKERATVSWSAERDGSIILDLQFESAGRELLGTFGGDIDNGRLLISLAVEVGPSGELVVTPSTSFSADIDILGIPNFLERRLTAQLPQRVAQETEAQLQASAQEIAQGIFQNLSEAGPDGNLLPTPSPDALYTGVKITDEHATLSWRTGLTPHKQDTSE